VLRPAPRARGGWFEPERRAQQRYLRSAQRPSRHAGALSPSLHGLKRLPLRWLGLRMGTRPEGELAIQQSSSTSHGGPSGRGGLALTLGPGAEAVGGASVEVAGGRGDMDVPIEGGAESALVGAPRAAMVTVGAEAAPPLPWRLAGVARARARGEQHAHR
jgi:hypothetical protein